MVDFIDSISIYNQNKNRQRDKPVKCFVVHLIEPPLATWSHPPLSRSSLFVAQFPLCTLVAEDLHLRGGKRGQQHHQLDKPSWWLWLFSPGSIPCGSVCPWYRHGGRRRCRSGRAGAAPWPPSVCWSRSRGTAQPSSPSLAIPAGSSRRHWEKQIIERKRKEETTYSALWDSSSMWPTKPVVIQLITVWCNSRHVFVSIL